MPAPWSLDSQALLQRLGSSRDGLTREDAAERLEREGPSRLAAAAKASDVRLLARQFGNPIMLLLLFAVTVSLVVGSYQDGAIILFIIFVSGLLGFWQERGATRAVERLQATVQLSATVLRSGRAEERPSEQVLPGDVVMLRAGDQVPGDGILLEARELFVIEAPITGESFPVEKRPGPCAAGAPLAERHCAVHLGTHVMSGTGRAVIVATGKHTELGRISEHLRRPSPRTDFEIGLHAFGALLLEVTLLLVIGIFAVNVYFHRPVIESLLFAVALAVGLTPQLLPAVVSVNLAHGAHAMALRKVIVKRLASIEEFGSMGVLCVDKTGTLTTGRVGLVRALAPDGRDSPSSLLQGHLNALHESGYLNPIDAALRAAPPKRVPRLTKLDEVPFDFTRRRLSVLLSHRDDHRLVTKGALESVLSCCSSVRVAGRLEPIAPWRPRIAEQLERLGEEGRRVVGVAMRGLGKRTEASVADEREMIFLGVLVFSDPPKQEARAAVAGLGALGVRIKLVTGDHRSVAVQVAREVGLPTEPVAVGAELENLTELALSQRVGAIDVFAEIEPDQKERIVRALRRHHAVGFLGDGINDAAALHAADVGISVESAVDVAKDAAQIVLLEKDLGVLLDGVREGRRTFANTLKYVFMATSANFGNMFSMAAASLFLPFLPLLPKQVLLANLLTDLPEMTISTDRVDAELSSLPQRWNVHFLRHFMLTFGLLSSLFDFATFAVLLFGLHAGSATFRTGWLIESVVSASLIVLVIRTRRPPWRSRPSKQLAATTIATIALALLLPYLPIAGMLSLRPLPVAFFAALAGVIALYVATAELAKRLFYRRR